MDKTPLYKRSIFGNHKMLRHSVNFLDKNLKFYFWLSNMMIHDSPARLEKNQQKAFLGTP